ncbi:MAG: RHS repeat protein, partial [Actinomycetota bacterium]|nr:RHS repeat protein [Actinomycetota bacterium]
MNHPSSRLTRALALAVTAVLTVTMSQQPAWAEEPTPYTPPKAAEQPAIKVGKVPTLPPAATAAKPAADRPAPVWPAAGRSDVALGATSTSIMLKGTRSAAAPAKMRVDVLDQAASARAGVRGVLFRANRADAAVTTTAKITVDYGKFATAYGGDWANRLRLVRLPECALTTPEKAGCAGTPLPSTNDSRAKQVSADVALSGAPQLMALSAAPNGSTGNFGSTTLRPAGTWSAGGSSGNFSWSFPVRVPPAIGGPEPTVELAYSSQSVDGRMVSTNNQPSEIGEGFDMGVGGYIERRFKPCSDDTDGGNNAGATYKDADDQCWATNNATMSLNGSGGELIKEAGESSNRWRLRTDDGSKIERRTGADNGAAEGEWWVVTTANGTQYWFGRDKLPGWTSGATTNSAWTVPVFGNHKGEPCNKDTFAASMCTRAWRWNLDYVVDPHGNTMSYWYETATNHYKSVATDKIQPYIRSGQIDHIVYGTRVEPDLATGKDTVFTGHGAARVDFTYADRCLASCTTHEDPQWPDTPWDLSCSSGSCDVRMPSFWTTRRLTTITTSTYAALTGKFRDVERWTLTHSFPDPEDTTRAGLWLDKVSHTGLVGTPTSLPDVTFGGKNMPNRVDGVDNAPAMNWRRLTDINTETGGIVHVDYLDTDCKTKADVPADDKNNTTRCYPVRWSPPGFPEQKDYFNRYVVNEVTETDRTGGSPRVLYHYDYFGSPAWHYADDDGLLPDNGKTWNVWRGYQKVGVTTGDPGESTYTETTYFRGMHGDYLSNTSTRTASVPDSLGGSTPDLDAYAGMVRESRVLLGKNGAEVSGELNDPWQSEATATRKIGGVEVSARFVKTEGTRSRVTLDHAPGVRTTYTKNTFDKYGMVVREDDFGDEAVAGDEQCTTTTFEPRNTGAWLLSMPHRMQTFAVDCAKAVAGGLTDAQVIGDARNYYDNHAYGVAPSVGNLTKTEQMATYNGGSPTYETLITTAYDDIGRVKESTDALGRISKTAYTP